MAFRYALAPLVPFRDAGVHRPGTIQLPQVLSALTNVVFVILFALWVASRRAARPVRAHRASPASLLNLYWFVKAWREDGLDDLLIGYYVWLAAFALLLGVAMHHRLSQAVEHRQHPRPARHHERHAAFLAARQVTIELRELVEIRGQPRQLALQHHARGLGHFRRAEMQHFVLRRGKLDRMNSSRTCCS